MIIVSDTTPVRYLTEIEKIEVLEKLFGRVLIPQTVFVELQHNKTPQRVKAWVQARPRWLEVRQADSSLFTPQWKIQDGEREAIALCLELKADAILLDDFAAIKEARRLGLPTLRTFAILERAAEMNLLDLPHAIKKISRTSFHLPPNEIIEAMLERDAQKKKQDEVGGQSQTPPPKAVAW